MLNKQNENLLYAVVAGGGGGSSSSSGGYSAPSCTWRWDCSARDAAKEAYDAATEARQNAEALRDDLSTEMGNVEALMGGYKGMYDSFMACGSSVANPANMGTDSGLGSIISCLSKYGTAVENAYNQALKEVEKCVQAEEDAKQTWKDTKCEHVCD